MYDMKYIPYGFNRFFDNFSNSGSSHSECKGQTFERFSCCKIPAKINNKKIEKND